jgi:hypothetical protein
MEDSYFVCRIMWKSVCGNLRDMISRYNRMKYDVFIMNEHLIANLLTINFGEIQFKIIGPA